MPNPKQCNTACLVQSTIPTVPLLTQLLAGKGTFVLCAHRLSIHCIVALDFYVKLYETKRWVTDTIVAGSSS